MPANDDLDSNNLSDEEESQQEKRSNSADDEKFKYAYENSILSISSNYRFPPERYSKLLNAREGKNSAVLFLDYSSFLRFFRNRHYVNEAKNLAQSLINEPSPENRLYLLIEEYKNRSRGGRFNPEGSYGRRLKFSIDQEARKVKENIEEKYRSDNKRNVRITNKDIINRCYELASGQEQMLDMNDQP